MAVSVVQVDGSDVLEIRDHNEPVTGIFLENTLNGRSEIKSVNVIGTSVIDIAAEQIPDVTSLTVEGVNGDSIEESVVQRTGSMFRTEITGSASVGSIVQSGGNVTITGDQVSAAFSSDLVGAPSNKLVVANLDLPDIFTTIAGMSKVEGVRGKMADIKKCGVVSNCTGVQGLKVVNSNSVDNVHGGITIIKNCQTVKDATGDLSCDIENCGTVINAPQGSSNRPQGFSPK